MRLWNIFKCLVWSNQEKKSPNILIWDDKEEINPHIRLFIKVVTIISCWATWLISARLYKPSARHKPCAQIFELVQLKSRQPHNVHVNMSSCRKCLLNMTELHNLCSCREPVEPHKHSRDSFTGRAQHHSSSTSFCMSAAWSRTEGPKRQHNKLSHTLTWALCMDTSSTQPASPEEPRPGPSVSSTASHRCVWGPGMCERTEAQDGGTVAKLHKDTITVSAALLMDEAQISSVWLLSDQL